jgi:acetyltransferase-like isoleucine patch superfamily enzyme
MRLAYSLILFANRAVDCCYSRALRGAFARCGAHTKIGRHAKLVAPHLISIGSHVVLGEYAWLNAKDDRGSREPTLLIGDGTYIGRFAQINAWRRVIIGSEVLIGDRVFISDADHNYKATDVAIKVQGDRFDGEVTLMDGCWIGIGAVILPGVSIGRNAVVAANSVVTESVPDHGVVGGIPAHPISRLPAKEA